MATNITGVTMPRPTVDPDIASGGNFQMGGQISTVGGGSWNESGDMYFEWDQISFPVVFLKHSIEPISAEVRRELIKFKRHKKWILA